MNHFVFTPMPLWGHSRAPCVLAARLVKEHESLVVSMIIPPNYFKNAEAEISAEFDDAPEETRRRLRVFSPYKSDKDDIFFNITALFASYSSTYKTLLEANAITCAQTGQVFDSAPSPCAVFLDVFLSPLMFAVRALSGSTVPIVGLCPLHASFLVHLYGPERMDGLGDLDAKIEAEAARLGVTAKDIGDTVFYHTEGRVSNLPGLPPMYDWEHFPQTLHTMPVVSDFLKLAYKGFETSNAIFSFSSYNLEKQSIDAMRSWFSEDWNKEVYTVGPLFPSKPTTYSISSKTASGSSQVEEFLETSLKKHGENSLVLISFGSLFWPIVSEYVEEVLEALMEKNIPFILSCASIYATVSDELVSRIHATESGLICKWVPQKYVLNHPATGWFMTHAGQSGVLEALDSGTPMICWPFEFDQPCAAAHLSENLHVAFELVQVRTGVHGMKPLYRHGMQAKGTRDAVGVEIREVLDACRGDKGAELRKNALEIKAKFSESWKSNGVSRKDMHLFLENFNIKL